MNSDNGNSSRTRRGAPHRTLPARPPAPKTAQQNAADVKGATRLVQLVEESGVELFHDPSDGAGYARIEVGGHAETHSITSTAMRRFLAQLAWRGTNSAYSSEVIAAARNLLEARAQFEGEAHPVHLRVAGDAGHVFVDLGDPTWRVLEISPDGWVVRTADDVPVRFRRSPGMMPLPEPIRGGSLDELAGFANVRPKDFPLLVGWLVGAWRYAGPYLALVLLGEQGCGKSVTARSLLDVVDPGQADLRAEPASLRDLAIAANSTWCLAYDNLSYVSPSLSDALCRLSTGGAFTTRRLYTDNEEQVFRASRPVLLNGIAGVASRSDLLDRALVLQLPLLRGPVTEKELWARFKEARPRIIGALADAISAALRDEATTHLDDAPRMADACTWICAATPALPFSGRNFLDAYRGNRDQADEMALEDPLAQALLDVVAQADSHWAGTMEHLLKALTDRAGEQATRDRAWPRTTQKLTAVLKRLAPNLRRIGVTIDRTRTGESRRVVITWRRSGGGDESPDRTLEARHYGRHPVTPRIHEGDDEGDVGDVVSGPSLGAGDQQTSLSDAAEEF